MSYSTELLSYGEEPNLKSYTLFKVVDDEFGEDAIEVSWWPSLLAQWGEEGVQAYIEAEGLWTFGYKEEALIKAEEIPDNGHWIIENPLSN